jgi:hypothetical protein
LANASYFGGSSTTSECWLTYNLKNVGQNAVFALLAAREFKLWRMYQKIRIGERRKVKDTIPILFVVFCIIATLLFVNLTWLNPFSQAGIKPCQRSQDAEKPSENMQAWANSSMYFAIFIHAVSLIISIIAWNVPSICSDAQAILVISIIGVIYAGISLASYHTATALEKVSYRITYTVLQFVFYLLTIFLLIFKRLLYIKYDKVELVKVASCYWCRNKL